MCIVIQVYIGEQTRHDSTLCLGLFCYSVRLVYDSDDLTDASLNQSMWLPYGRIHYRPTPRREYFFFSTLPLPPPSRLTSS